MLVSVDQLRAARCLLRLDLKNVAEALNMSRANLNNVELGKVTPKLDTALALMGFYTAKGIEFGQNGWVRLRPSSPSPNEVNDR